MAAILFPLLVSGYIWLAISGEVTAEETGYYPRNYTTFDYVINHPKLCSRPGDGNGTALTLLMMVVTKPDHFEARQTIRQTWGSIIYRTDVSLAFLMGNVPEEDVRSRIVAEDALYGDILQESFQDTYRNLTLKTVMMLRWVSENCDPLPLFLLKIDDDCFLNPRKAFEFLESKADSGNAIYGRVFGGHPTPHRNKKSKWYMSKEEYPPKEYPVFASGPAYFVTGSAVPLLYEAVHHTSLISLEDVYVNGVCAKYAGIPNVQVDSITASFNPRTCKVGNSITFHELPPSKLQMLWWIIYDTRFKDHCQGDKLPDTMANKVLNSIIKDKDF